MGEPINVTAILDTLGGSPGEPAVDLLMDPGAGCQALDGLAEHEGLVIRVLPRGAAPKGSSHGPAPIAPLWMRVMRGALEVGIAGRTGGMVRCADHVRIEHEDEPCCASPGCDRRRSHATVWLVLEPLKIPERDAPDVVLVAEQRVIGPRGEHAIAHAVASRLASVLGVPVRRGDAEVTLAEVSAPASLATDLRAKDFARFVVATEGDRVVLRDWESRGPRASVARNTWIGGILAVLSAGAFWQLAMAVRSSDSSGYGTCLAIGVVASLLTLAAVAFLGVARFASRYAADSAALLAVARDRMIVLPWVGRDGAVDARPEGRLGAAIPLGEVRRPKVRATKAGLAVELDTDHGAIEVMVCDAEPVANAWAAVLDRVFDEARHPREAAGAKPTAKQRARERAALGELG